MVEVDEHVPAEDDGTRAGRERWYVDREVVQRDIDLSTKLGDDLKLGVGTRQESGATRGRKPGGLALRVPGSPGSLERLGRDVGGVHPRIRAAELLEHHRDAVRLLTVRAAGAPDPDRLIERREHVLGEGIELSRIAEERRLLHGDAIQQALERDPVSVEARDIRLHIQTGLFGFVGDASRQSSAQRGIETQTNATSE